MTSPNPFVATVSPDSVLAASSPGEYLAVDLVITITNQTSTSYELPTGLTIAIPVDPGGSGSETALVLSSASGTDGGQGQPTPTVTVLPSVEPETEWAFAQADADTCTYTVVPNSGTFAPYSSAQFGFHPVVADLTPGIANITVTVPATATGTALTLPPLQVTKLPATCSATLDIETPLLTMPVNTTNLTWQVLAADSCALAWTPSSTVVTYNGEPCANPWSDAPFQFEQGTPVPVATVYQDTSFTLTATGAGAGASTTQAVTLATPTLTVLTIPPLVTGVSPASGDPGGGQQVTITGTGLFGTSTIVGVAFGGADATAITVNPDGTSITATTPPGPGGSNVPVIVTTPTGSSVATPAASYTYASAGVPVVTGIEPPGGQPASGQQVTITGTSLAGVTAVAFGSASAASFTVNTDGTSITATVPPVTLSAGAETSIVAVTVTTPAGSSPPTPAASYAYAAAGIPVVCGVGQDGAGNPYGGQNSVPVTGIYAQNSVTIGGVNLSGATSVSFGHATISAPSFTVNPAGTMITATAPPADPADISPGTYGTTVDVTVTVAGDTTSPATSATSPAAQYTYASTPPSPPAQLNQPTAPSVSPYQPFLLLWSCFNNTNPTLNWSMSQEQPGVTDIVTVTSSESESISNGGTIATCDTAVVTVTAPTVFTLHVPPPSGPGPIQVPLGIDTVAIGDFSSSGPVVDPTDGSQSVILSWTAQNATGFTLAGGGLAGESLPYDQRSCQPVPLLQIGPSLFASTFTVTASGFGGSGAYAPASQTITVDPRPAEVIIETPQVQAQISDPALGTQVAIVEWQALNATSVTITGGAQQLSPGLRDTLASVELPFPPPADPGDYAVTIQAGGYVQSGVAAAGTVTIVPAAVTIKSFTASASDVLPGKSVTLNWTATAPTGFTLSASPPSGSPVLFGPQAAEAKVRLGVTTTFTLTAQGYTEAVSRSVTVRVAFKSPKESGIKEGSGVQREKGAPDSPEAVPAVGTVPGPGDLADPAAEADDGTQRSFIGPDERPGVAAPGAQGQDPAAGPA